MFYLFIKYYLYFGSFLFFFLFNRPKVNHSLNIEKAVSHLESESDEKGEDLSQNNPTQDVEIESSEFGIQDIHEEIIDDTQKTMEECSEEVVTI